MDFNNDNVDNVDNDDIVDIIDIIDDVDDAVNWVCIMIKIDKYIDIERERER